MDALCRGWTSWTLVALGMLGPGLAAPAADPGQVNVAVDACFTPPSDGDASHLFIRAAIRPGWHIYPLTQAPGGPVASAIAVEPSASYRLAGEFRSQSPPQSHADRVAKDLVVETYDGQVVWSAPMDWAPGSDPAAISIHGTLTAQPCSANNCFPPQEFPFTARLARAEPDGLPRFGPSPFGPAAGPSVSWAVIAAGSAGGLILLAAATSLLRLSRPRKEAS